MAFFCKQNKLQSQKWVPYSLTLLQVVSKVTISQEEKIEQTNLISKDVIFLLTTHVDKISISK